MSIDQAASIARLVGQTITPEIAADIIGSQVELDRLREENAKLRARVEQLEWTAARGLARRPPGRDR